MKKLEFGYSRIRIENPAQKPESIVNDADKMSALGWEFKGYFDAMVDIWMFYQREAAPVEPVQPVEPPVVPPPVVEPVSPTT